MTTKTVLARLACLAGVDHLMRRRRSASLTIFGYHGVKRDRDPATDWLLVAESAFERQMRFVRRHYDCVPLSEGVRRLLAGEIRRPTAVVTFDDGYRNNLTVAKPILTSLSIPATVFLATAFIGSDRTLWTTRLGYGLGALKEGEISLSQFSMPPVKVGPRNRSETSRFIGSLKEFPAGTRDAVVAHLDQILGDVRVPDAFAFLTWDQVRELAADGSITIGAHTVHHELLSRVSDDQLRTEIFHARDMIAERTGRAPREFAFPNGRPQDIDARSAPLLREAGFTCAVTTVPGPNDRDADPYYLSRPLVGGSDSFDLFRLTAVGLIPFRQVRPPARR